MGKEVKRISILLNMSGCEQLVFNSLKYEKGVVLPTCKPNVNKHVDPKLLKLDLNNSQHIFIVQLRAAFSPLQYNPIQPPK